MKFGYPFDFGWADRGYSRRDRFLGSLAMSAGAGLYIVARLEQPLAPPIARLLALVLGATMVLVGLKLARRGKQVLRESQARQ